MVSKKRLTVHTVSKNGELFRSPCAKKAKRMHAGIACAKVRTSWRPTAAGMHTVSPVPHQELGDAHACGPSRSAACRAQLGIS